MNKTFEELHQWRLEEIVGTVLPMVPDETKPAVYQLFDHISQGSEIAGLDILLLRKDGSSFWANVSLYPLKNEEGAVVACLGIGRDVTEKRRAEEALRKSEKLSVVGELAAGIAHEIRNPLTSLKGFMQLLKEQNTHYIDIMLSELERINNIVNEFMSMAKPHSIRFVKVNLPTVIEEIVSFMQPQALLHNAEITIQLQNRLGFFWCEPNQIKQLLMNLLKNAMEAMPDGGEVRIEAYREEDETIVLQVTDHGKGIPEEGMARLGEPFYSLKENGTGLGLAVCHRIVEAHNGRLTFRSQLGKGTAVEIAFPTTD
ncbi:PAS domain S-box-containing protein [Cohnella lubricantis]|nr:PAS domain S-box-containing protein [Cohnella lubricantis]